MSQAVERKIFPHSHAEWHRWFAWHPVKRRTASHPRIMGDWAWLRIVERRAVEIVLPLNVITYEWEYRGA